MDIVTFVVEHESQVRMSFFLGLLAIMGIWELKKPKRVPKISKAKRWLNNLGLVFFNSFISRIILPIASTGMAVLAVQNNWGVFNYYNVSPLIATIAFVIVMDFIIYIQHVMVHAIPLFWRFHRVHHADLDYDVTTGARFHTIEIIFSMFIKLIAIILLGPSVFAVILFEVILNGMAMFNHGNVGLPKSFDTLLRFFIVTPDMHRVHHSIEEDETNSNFGFNLTWWDRIFGTYRKEVRKGQVHMTIGLKNIRNPKETNFILGMLVIPFRGKITQYAINAKKDKSK
ncbi:MAG: sterol desaturase family protein [Campylobacteraceae bacterium]|nr:sterol desaturase family protein [Campylobacteraceae bacterium]